MRTPSFRCTEISQCKAAATLLSSWSAYTAFDIYIRDHQRSAWNALTVNHRIVINRVAQLQGDGDYVGFDGGDVPTLGQLSEVRPVTRSKTETVMVVVASALIRRPGLYVYIYSRQISNGTLAETPTLSLLCIYIGVSLLYDYSQWLYVSAALHVNDVRYRPVSDAPMWMCGWHCEPSFGQMCVCDVDSFLTFDVYIM